MRQKIRKWEDADTEGRALLLYAPGTYPDIADAADLIARLSYIYRVAPQEPGEWTEEDTLNMIAKDWPEVDEAELRAIVTAEPDAFVAFFEADVRNGTELIE